MFKGHFHSCDCVESIVRLRLCTVTGHVCDWDDVIVLICVQSCNVHVIYAPIGCDKGSEDVWNLKISFENTYDG